ncbi:hypothetical protein HOD29_02500 [archaeon]|jgi:hypothetical protein|nr:hypothetical protein [archaeon]
MKKTKIHIYEILVSVIGAILTVVMFSSFTEEIKNVLVWIAPPIYALLCHGITRVYEQEKIFSFPVLMHLGIYGIVILKLI